MTEDAQGTPSAPFKTGWFYLDIPGYRPGEHMYNLFSYEDLPPIDGTQLDGTFRWLVPEWKKSAPAHHPVAEPEPLPRHFMDCFFAARGLGLVLPETFIEFMTSDVLECALIENNCCYFALPEKIVPCPGQNEGYVIRFMCDQQDCLIWYLYLNPTTQEECVLVSSYYLDPEYDDEEDFEATYSEEDPDNEIFICAPSFEAFLYRIRLEDVLNEKLARADPPDLSIFTEEERRYLEHYKR